MFKRLFEKICSSHSQTEWLNVAKLLDDGQKAGNLLNLSELDALGPPKNAVRWHEILEQLIVRKLMLAHVYSTRDEIETVDGFKCKPLANLEMSSTDVFLEKAQYHLTERALRFQFYAQLAIAIGALILLAAFLYYEYYRPIDDIETQVATWANPYVGLTIYLTRSATVAALFAFSIVMCFSFARAFFHESTILLNRRHSLRFGRLYVYLKLGGIQIPSELSEARKALSVIELQEAFGWNRETSTAFKEIKTELNVEGPAGRVMAMVEKSIEKIVNMEIEKFPEKIARRRGQND